jgi:hypothetical protein
MTNSGENFLPNEEHAEGANPEIFFYDDEDEETRAARSAAYLERQQMVASELAARGVDLELAEGQSLEDSAFLLLERTETIALQVRGLMLREDLGIIVDNAAYEAQRDSLTSQQRAIDRQAELVEAAILIASYEPEVEHELNVHMLADIITTISTHLQDPETKHKYFQLLEVVAGNKAFSDSMSLIQTSDVLETRIAQDQTDQALADSLAAEQASLQSILARNYGLNPAHEEFIPFIDLLQRVRSNQQLIATGLLSMDTGLARAYNMADRLGLPKHSLLAIFDQLGISPEED